MFNNFIRQEIVLAVGCALGGIVCAGLALCALRYFGCIFGGWKI